MKKILLLLFFITTNMGTIRLGAYCFYNHSRDKTLSIRIYSREKTSTDDHPPRIMASHRLKPGSKECKDWKTLSNNPKRVLFWSAYQRTPHAVIPLKTTLKKLGKGFFPVGGHIHFSGWTTAKGPLRIKGKFEVYYNNEKWQYWKSPWNYEEKPWKSYKD